MLVAFPMPEVRIEELPPYANAIRRMTRRAVEGAAGLPDIPILKEHDSVDRVGLLLLTGDRGLAGGFNGSAVRRAVEEAQRALAEGLGVRWLVVGRKGAGTVRFRGFEVDARKTTR